MLSISESLQRIEILQQEIDTFTPWNEEVRKKIYHKIQLDWNYNSQSIEGGTLTRQETRTIMIGSVEVHGKSLKDILEMQKHNELIQDIMKIGAGNKRLSESRIKQIHAAIMFEENPANRKLIGNWKIDPNEIINFKHEKYDFTPPSEVPEKIHSLLNRTNANWDRLEGDKSDTQHPVLMAFDFHLDFLSIHPFYDGNGRTARILLNLILIAFGFPPLIVRKENKDVYYRLIAEIQGYGATRELYYSFLANLLIQSQEMILHALHGGDIEEKDDLQKEIELFQKQEAAKAKGITPVTFSSEVLKKTIGQFLVPLFEQIRAETKVFDEFFASKKEWIETLKVQIEDPDRQGHEKTEFQPWKIFLQADSNIGTQEILDSIYQETTIFHLIIKWTTYQFKVLDPFSLRLKLEVVLSTYTILIMRLIDGGGSQVLQKGYVELIQGSQDNNTLIKETVRILFEKMKQKVEKES